MADMYFWAFMYCLICPTPPQTSPHGTELSLRGDWQKRKEKKRGGVVSFSALSYSAASMQRRFPCCCRHSYGNRQGNYSRRVAPLCVIRMLKLFIVVFLKCVSFERTLGEEKREEEEEKKKQSSSWLRHAALDFFPVWQVLQCQGSIHLAPSKQEAIIKAVIAIGCWTIW